MAIDELHYNYNYSMQQWALTTMLQSDNIIKQFIREAFKVKSAAPLISSINGRRWFLAGVINELKSIIEGFEFGHNIGVIWAGHKVGEEGKGPK